MNASAPSAVKRDAGLSIWIAAARPRTLTAAVSPVVVGLALGYRSGRIDLPLALDTLAAAILIQIATNLANDYYDFVSGADTDARLGPPRVTQRGLIQPDAVRNAAFITLGLAALAGSYLVRIGGWPILLIGVVSIVSALAYTTGPYPLAYHGLGELFVCVFFGLAAVNGTVFLQTGKLTLLSIAVSVPIASLVTAILVVNNLRDIDTDRKAGKRTLAVRFGSRFARAEYAVLVGAAFIATPVLVRMGGWMLLLPLAVLPLALRAITSIYRNTGQDLNHDLARTAGLHCAFALLLALAVVI